MAVSDATRREVIRRAGERCEYCRLPVSAMNVPPHVDHVRARQHRGSENAGNLALTCDRCNLHKGTNLTGVDPETDQIAPLFNPRTMTWDEHFSVVGAGVLGLTPEGRTTAELLAMNARNRLNVRALLAETGDWP